MKCNRTTRRLSEEPGDTFVLIPTQGKLNRRGMIQKAVAREGICLLAHALESVRRHALLVHKELFV